MAESEAHAQEIRAEGAHGDAGTLPPAPAERDISPAPDHYRDPPPMRVFLWPVLWLGLALLVWVVVAGGGWTDLGAHHDGDGDDHGTHEDAGH